MLVWACAATAQENRFNPKLDKYCRASIQSFRTISPERQALLDNIARQLATKRFVIFTCLTNSRRTQMLQVWAQTSFYYYGLYDKHSFSAGDSVTGIYPQVATVLEETGFIVNRMISTEPNGYSIAISKEYPENILSSKDEVGTIDTLRSVVVNICEPGEPKGELAQKQSALLPYQSPVRFEKSLREKQKYQQLNHQIAVEMLFLGYLTKQYIFKLEHMRY